MMVFDYNLTEEVVRWSFEVMISKNHDWLIAFTNPTAGPWKTIKLLDRYQRIEDAKKFEIDEKRPDLILINYRLKEVIIIEAKDNLNKLMPFKQIEKTVNVYIKIKTFLKEELDPSDWNDLDKFNYRFGLMWGQDDRYNDYNMLYHNYKLILNKKNVVDEIIGFESKKRTDNSIICTLHSFINDNSDKNEWYDEIARSIGIDLVY